MFHSEVEFRAAYDAAAAVIQVAYASGEVEFNGSVNRAMDKLAIQVANAVIRAGDSIPDILDDDADMATRTSEYSLWAS